MELAAGSHVYNARFILPQHLPQNHEGDDGHIRYEAKVHVDVPWDFDTKETASFYLKPRFNLNEFQHLREPVRSEANKTFGCCCWESDPLHIYNVLPCRGFVPGDRVQYSLEFFNESDVSISSATVKLVEKVVYHAQSPRCETRESRRTLWQHEFSPQNNNLVARMMNKVFSTGLHFDPAWNFKFFDGCGIITVEYYLKSQAHVSGCHSDLSNWTTITMGTVPFGNYGTSLPPLFPNAPMPLPSAPADVASAPPAEPISEQPLPSYDDTISKLKMPLPPVNPGIGWAATNQIETRKKLK